MSLTELVQLLESNGPTTHQPLVNPDEVSVTVSLRDAADPFLRETLTLERDTSLEARLPR